MDCRNEGATKKLVYGTRPPKLFDENEIAKYRTTNSNLVN